MTMVSFPSTAESRKMIYNVITIIILSVSIIKVQCGWIVTEAFVLVVHKKGGHSIKYLTPLQLQRRKHSLLHQNDDNYDSDSFCYHTVSHLQQPHHKRFGMSRRIRRKIRQPSCLYSNMNDDDDASYTGSHNNTNHNHVSNILQSTITLHPTRSVLFSLLMILSGAILGPFLDSYHSLFHVLQYDHPLTLSLISTTSTTNSLLSLVTTTWVPPLFGIAGFLIGWMYILLDVYYNDNNSVVNSGNKQNGAIARYQSPSPPKILYGIAYFTFQYWLSGLLYQSGVDRPTIFWIMTLTATYGFWTLDRTKSGCITSFATAIGGPLIEVGLISLSRHDALFHGMGYHYTDLGETGFFPLWIIPIYFLGGPANGNLARGYWTLLCPAMDASNSADASFTMPKSTPCVNCDDTRCSTCPNW
jgi:hypothetical protein